MCCKGIHNGRCDVFGADITFRKTFLVGHRVGMSLCVSVYLVFIYSQHHIRGSTPTSFYLAIITYTVQQCNCATFLYFYMIFCGLWLYILIPHHLLNPPWGVGQLRKGCFLLFNLNRVTSAGYVRFFNIWIYGGFVSYEQIFSGN